MAKINTEIIKKDYSVNRVAVQSSYVATTVFVNQVFSHSGFLDTLLINNKSNTFIKNTTFDYNGSKTIQTNIDILNINQSKLNGQNVTISNLNNTFIVNTDNSQSNIKSQQLSSSTLYQSRNQDQSFFNFPTPAEAKDFTVQPMMISNGERTIWSEGKYGWINNADNLTSLDNLPHDLYGQNLTANLTELPKTLSSFHNGSLTIIGKEVSDDTINIKNCSIKLTLSGFNFRKLNVENCDLLYLNDCNFNKETQTTTLIEMVRNDISHIDFKQGNLGNVTNYCLSSSNSKIFLKNNKDLTFQHFFVGIHANNNSQIYMIPNNDGAGILLKEDLSNYNQLSSIRPIFMLASNGSTINCNYYKYNENNNLVNIISANIKYPTTFDGYKPKNDENQTFIISDNQMFDQNENYKRVKSLLITLCSQINNSRVNCSLNTSEEITQTSHISIPLFGLYQAAKPKMNEQYSRWQLANSFYHYLSGTEANHISAEGNNEYTLNVCNNNTIFTNFSYFSGYNCPSTNNSNVGGFFPYSASQPHLAHYFLKQPLRYTENTINYDIIPHLSTITLLDQGIVNITYLKNLKTSFKGIIDETQKDVFINPSNGDFYVYNALGVPSIVTDTISSHITYKLSGAVIDINKPFNYTITVKKKGKKKKYNYIIQKDNETNKFYYLENDIKNYSLDNAVKNDLVVKYVNGDNVEVITDVIKNSAYHITTFDETVKKNVDVYYNPKTSSYYYWSSPSQQVAITLDTFTNDKEDDIDDGSGDTEVNSKTILSNQYFKNGVLDITDVVAGRSNQFKTYVDGQNRIVSYDYENKEFYYYSSATDKVICTDKINITTNYIYNNIIPTDITNIEGNTKYFPVKFSNNVTSSVYYNKTNGTYYCKNGTTVINTITIDGEEIDVNEYVSKSVVKFLTINDSGTEVLTIYYYEVNPINISNILANKFTATIDGSDKEVIYRAEDNTFNIKINDSYVDVTDQVINDVNWEIFNQNNQAVDVTELFKNPNYSYVAIDGLNLYFDDSNNIFYTKQIIPITVNVTKNEDGESVWAVGQQEYDVSDLLNNNFAVTNNGTTYNIYYDVLTKHFKAKVNNTWTNVNDWINPHLTYFYEGVQINSVINDPTNNTLNITINGVDKVLTYNPSTRTFNDGTEDLTYYVTGSIECYYQDGNEAINITDMITNNVYLQAEVSSKIRDVFYDPQSGYYLNKVDKTNIYKPTMKCYYKDTEITPAAQAATSFEGGYIDDQHQYFNGTIIYNDENWFLNDQNVTDYINANIVTEQILKLKYNIDAVVADPTTSFNGLVNDNNKEEYKKVYYDNTENKFYIKNGSRVNKTSELSSQITYLYNSTPISNEAIYDGEEFTIPNGTDSLSVYYDRSDGNFKLSPNEDSKLTDETIDSIIKNNLTVNYTVTTIVEEQETTTTTNITRAFIYSDIQYFEDVNGITIYYNPTEGYYAYSDKTYLNDNNNYTIDIKLIGTNWFYFEDKVMTNILNGSSFPYDVLRQIYYDDTKRAYVYNNIFGQRTDISQQINPNVYKNYFYKRNKKFNNINHVIFNGDSIADNGWKKNTPVYFDYIKCDNMSPKAYSTSTDFGQCFYYLTDNNRVYDTKGTYKGRHIASAVTLSTYYFGNLIDVTSSQFRQSFSTYVKQYDKQLQIYYDLYGGKTKNQGVYYYYNTNGVMQNANKLSANVQKVYYFESKNITDVVNGANFEWTTTSKDKTYKMYYDQLTGRFYYLSGDVPKVLTGANQGNKKLSFMYNGKLDLTAMKQKSISAFYSFISNQLSGTKLTFKISKSNALTIKNGSTEITDLPTNKINDRWYLDRPDIKRIGLNKKTWFFTPIDGITRRVKYYQNSKNKGVRYFYYKIGSKKYDVNEKILSNLTYYHNNVNINGVVKGVPLYTKFEQSIQGGIEQKVYYDKNNKYFYFTVREILTEEEVANNIWVDITDAYLKPKKWSFLAYVSNQAREVFYNKKKNLYYYISNKKEVEVSNRNQIEGNEYFIQEDDKNYYHNQNLSSYLMWDSYLKVRHNNKFINVYRDLQTGEYYYITKKKIVTELIEPKLQVRYNYGGQILTDTVFPVTNTVFINQGDYKHYFDASILSSNTKNTLYHKKIWYHPSAGFYFTNTDGSKHDAAWLTGHTNRIVNDQICPDLQFFYYDRQKGVENNITYAFEAVNNNKKQIFEVTSGNSTLSCYIDNPKNEYNIKPASTIIIKKDVCKKWDYKLHQTQIKTITDENITKDVINNIVIKYGSRDITRVVEDSKNFFLSIDGGLKRYIYYNPTNNSYYYYKNNKFTRNTAINTTIKANIFELLINGQRKYFFSYDQNISIVQADTKDKYRFLGTTQQQVFYDPFTKDYYYYLDEDETMKQIVTPYIEPYIKHKYYYVLGDQTFDMTNVLNGLENSVFIETDNYTGYINYDYKRDVFTYSITEGGQWADNITVQSDIHNSIEMVCSNNAGNVNNSLNIANSKLYQNVYKLKV